MAEYAAHLTTTIGERPSIFEVLAQESLSTGLRNGIKYLFQVIAEYKPEKFGGLVQYFDELYTCIDFVIQFVHLASYSASFSEHFYGLKRVSANLNYQHSKNNSFQLPLKQFYRSLITLILIPYVKVKLENLFHLLKEKDADGSLWTLPTKKKNYCKLYLKVYPSLHFAWEILSLYYQVFYAVGRNKYHSFLLHLSGTELATLTTEDMDLFESGKAVGCSHYSNGRWKNLSNFFLNPFLKGVAKTTSISLATGAFFLQFLDWWYSREDTPVSFAPLPIPPPPTKWHIDFSPEICPICQKKRTNDTVLSSSGFVFCYPCIFTFLRDNKKCPVTSYPSTTSQLIRLHVQD